MSTFLNWNRCFLIEKREKRWSGFKNFLLFWFSRIFRKFSKKIEFSRILEKFHFSISISRHFHFTFHFSKRVNQIFISLFTSRKQWNRFSFHFSLLEKSESNFHFTLHFSKRVKQIFISLFTFRTFNIHSRRTLRGVSSPLLISTLFFCVCLLVCLFFLFVFIFVFVISVYMRIDIVWTHDTSRSLFLCLSSVYENLRHVEVGSVPRSRDLFHCRSQSQRSWKKRLHFYNYLERIESFS